MSYVRAAYLLVGVLGLRLIDTSTNVLAINQADNVLHLCGGRTRAGSGRLLDETRRTTGSG